MIDDNGVYHAYRCPGNDQATVLNGLALGVLPKRWGGVQGCGSRRVGFSEYSGMWECSDCGVYFTETEFRAFVEATR